LVDAAESIVGILEVGMELWAYLPSASEVDTFLVVEPIVMASAEGTGKPVEVTIHPSLGKH
jgi:hypothetical protein